MQQLNQGHVHLIGICGTAMASLALLFKEKGYDVTGSDQNIYPPMSTLLLQKGIKVFEGYQVENLARVPDLVIIGNAISRGNPEAEWVLDHNWFYLSQADALKEYFIRGTTSITITGTHGKTTTTAVTAHLFRSSGLKCSFFVGGIPKNFDTSASYQEESAYFISEGDEYDTAFFDKTPKFLHYLPHIAVINHLEYDHADIYASFEEIKKQFRLLVKLIPSNGLVIGNGDVPEIRQILDPSYSKVQLVGFKEDNDIVISIQNKDNHSCTFSLQNKKEGTTFGPFKTKLVEDFNIKNTSASLLIGLHEGIDLELLQKAVSTFEGVLRRQEIIYQRNDVTVIEDFAHHPTSIKLVLQSIREKYKGHQLWTIFEPRSWTMRKNIFQDVLPHSLAVADCAILSEVYGLSKLKVEERLDIQKVIKDVEKAGRKAWMIASVDEIVSTVSKQLKRPAVIAILSNGGFEGIYDKIKKALDEVN